jgi:hypothetical protein
VVGKTPGASKVSQARNRGIQLIGLHDLKHICEGTALEDAAPAVITNFSAGYMGNGKALTWSAATLETIRNPGNTIDAARSNRKAATKHTKSKKKTSESNTDNDDVKPPAQKKHKTKATKKKKTTHSDDAENIHPNMTGKNDSSKSATDALDNFDGLKVKELKELCKQHDLMVSGTKAVLKKRLEDRVGY